MLDWSKILNISVVAAMGALTLFFLISTIVVAAKGKRKCNAFDVILRILATLVFIAATAMSACSVLTMIDGSIRIVVGPLQGAENEFTALFLFNGSSLQLPVPDLFALLATTIGSDLAIALFICSLAALIVDCLVANKKEKKQPKSKPQPKSPEQLKREAELEKIRRIGERAVQKTSAVAEKQAATDKADASVPDDTVTESSSDWRTAQPEEEKAPTEFVGIKDNVTDDNFDDSFDDDFDSPVEESFDTTDNSNNADVFDDGSIGSEIDIDTENGETQRYDEDLDADEGDNIAADAEEDSQSDHGDAAADGIAVDNAVEDNSVEDKVQAEETTRSERDFDDEAVAEKEEFESAADIEDTIVKNESDNIARKELDGIEPDRDIYIPDIRTVVKGSNVARSAAPRRADPAARKPQSAARSATQKRSAPSSASAKKSARPSSAAAKTAKPKSVTSNKSVPVEKKLPVTRRYVILDRRNAVNMFGEYLKEREKQAKDKLESSINTIIIE